MNSIADIALVRQPGFFLTLPPEIVSEIFIHFLPTYPARPPFGGRLSPLLLCQICRNWRQIARSTPKLWRAIQIHTDSPTIGNKNTLAVVDQWLSRARACPLSFSLKCLWPEVLQIFVTYCAQWHDVEIEVPFDFFPMIDGEMSLLQRLSIGPSDIPYEHDTPVTVCDRAPGLTHVMLSDCFTPAVCHLPWAQITHLDACALYENECTVILSQTPSIVQCSMFVCSPMPGRPHGASSVLPCLRELSLLPAAGELHDMSVTEILARLELPALRRLQVCEPCFTDDPLDTLKTLISRSRCSLEELRVDMSTRSEAEYREAFPAIRSIHIDSIDVGP
ncbi:hypothetical protein C8R43DRAFT_1236534 [Mycena crocata]|nr:hypothetical protein C8R43DRAFT_1236534 [Mycena crocata]